MKRHYQFYMPLAFMALFFLWAKLAEAQEPIQNGNFEIWETKVLYESPVGWLTQYYPETANLTTFKETDAVDGDYSIKLVTIEYLDDGEPELDFGFLIYGEFQEDFPIGIPWTETVDKLHFSARYDIAEGDASLVWIRLSKDGNTIFEKVHPIAGSQAEWEELTIDLEFEGGTAIQPDSMLLAFISSPPDPEFFGVETIEPAPGSWISIDDIYFTLGESTEKITPPNHSLEIWEDITIEEPQAWASSNILTIEFNNQNVTKSTDSYSGTYAVRMEVIEEMGYTEPAVLSYGDKLWQGGVPYTDKPEGVSFAAKYFPVDDDSAHIYIFFSNEGHDFHVAGNNIMLTKENQDYRTFGTTFFFPPDIDPDTVNIQIFTGNNPGSILLVDDIKFGPARNVTFNVKDESEEVLEYALISIDGLFPQQTDVFGTLVTRMPEGNYHFTVEKGGFTDYQGILAVSGEDVIIDVIMTASGNGADEFTVTLKDADVDKVYFEGNQFEAEVYIPDLPGMAEGLTPEIIEFVFTGPESYVQASVFSTKSISPIENKTFTLSGTIGNVNITGVIGIQLSFMGTPAGVPFPLISTLYDPSGESDFGMALAGVSIPEGEIVSVPEFGAIQNLYNTEQSVSFERTGQGSITFSEGLNIIDNREQLGGLTNGMNIVGSANDLIYYAEIDPASLGFLASRSATITLFNVPEEVPQEEFSIFTTPFGVDASNDSGIANISNLTMVGDKVSFDVSHFSRYSLMLPDNYTFTGREESSRLFIIYPNPVNDAFYITHYEDVRHITIASLHGQIVFDSATNGKVQSVETSHLERGMYIVSLRTVQGNNIQRKLTVN